MAIMTKFLMFILWERIRKERERETWLIIKTNFHSIHLSVLFEYFVSWIKSWPSCLETHSTEYSVPIDFRYALFITYSWLTKMKKHEELRGNWWSTFTSFPLLSFMTCIFKTVYSSWMSCQSVYELAGIWHLIDWLSLYSDPSSVLKSVDDLRPSILIFRLCLFFALRDAVKFFP